MVFTWMPLCTPLGVYSTKVSGISVLTTSLTLPSMALLTSAISALTTGEELMVDALEDFLDGVCPPVSFSLVLSPATSASRS